MLSVTSATRVLVATTPVDLRGSLANSAWWPGQIAVGSVCDAPMSEMDVLPTFVTLAGGSVPTDHPIDGKNVWPVLASQTKASPHDALFYFNSNSLEAVRSGPWKLAITAQALNKAKVDTEIVKHTGPRLYNLDTHIGELTDVAAQHPDIVARLQRFVSKMDSDLGVKDTGPGVRRPGRVANPKPLLKRIDTEYD
jgi:arylsulfatase A